MQLFILIYVDDIIIIGSSQMHIDKLLHQLRRDLPIKDLGPLNVFLSIETHRSSDVILLSQSRYIYDLL